MSVLLLNVVAICQLSNNSWQAGILVMLLASGICGDVLFVPGLRFGLCVWWALWLQAALAWRGAGGHSVVVRGSDMAV